MAAEGEDPRPCGPCLESYRRIINKTAGRHRVHRGKHGAHREMPQRITRRSLHPAGEFKCADHHAIRFAPCTPSELWELCDGVELG